VDKWKDDPDTLLAGLRSGTLFRKPEPQRSASGKTSKAGERAFRVCLNPQLRSESSCGKTSAQVESEVPNCDDVASAASQVCTGEASSKVSSERRPSYEKTLEMRRSKSAKSVRKKSAVKQVTRVDLVRELEAVGDERKARSEASGRSDTSFQTTSPVFRGVSMADVFVSRILSRHAQWPGPPSVGPLEPLPAPTRLQH
jgi:hypothetical protein